jgi:hypothetical protein
MTEKLQEQDRNKTGTGQEQYRIGQEQDNKRVGTGQEQDRNRTGTG